MRGIDLTRTKHTILIMIFAITVIVTYISLNYKSASPVSTTMDSATLPIVMMQTESGTLFNPLHGYTIDVDATLISDSMTPLPDDKKLSIVINDYDEAITKLSYEIRKLDDMTLIENTTVTKYDTNGSQINAVLNIKNLIENDEEYMLKINISTEKHEQISYYTKIFNSTNIGIQDKIDFALNFNSCTFDYRKIADITSWIETKTSGDNTNYGKVNINCTQSQIGWGDLNPTVESTIIPTIKEMNNEIASIYLQYTMATPNSAGSYDSYNVSEYYRVRQTTSTMYLLNFERETNQIFDSKNDLMQSSRINLGINSNSDVSMECSLDGKYASFVNQGALWGFDDSNNTFTKIFSFEAEDSDNVRELYNRHEIKIMDVNKEENGSYTENFIVYGYMNRGAHEGEVGVSLCTYNNSSNQVQELLFIPVNVPYEVLSENVGEVAYIGDNNVFYIMLDECLYSIDLTSKEKMIEITGLTDDRYAVSADGKAIAYSLSEKLYDTDKIRIFNMGTGSDYEIKAADGDKLRVLGYIKNDFIYGIAHGDDILTEDNGSVTFPMYRIEIIDTSYSTVKDYEVQGIYVSQTSIAGMRLNLSRVVKNSEGNYESTTIDQLINRDENEVTNGLEIEEVTTENRKKEVYIDLVNTIMNADKAAMRTSKEVIFTSGETIEIEAAFEERGRYYVYGYGKFQGSFASLERAISRAYSTYGIVYDRDSDYIWKRYKETSNSISIAANSGTGSSLARCVKMSLAYGGYDVDVSLALDSGKTAIDIISDTTGGKELNLKGVTVENVLYYTNIGMPVVARVGDSTYVIITGYDSKNVTYYDISTGGSVTLSLVDANKLFTQWGNVFIAYFR